MLGASGKVALDRGATGHQAVGRTGQIMIAGVTGHGDLDMGLFGIA